MARTVSIGNQAEDADRTGECHRFGIYSVGAAWYVIATGCGHITHRHVIGFACERLELFESFPYLFRGVRTASSWVYTQYKSVDIRLFGKIKYLRHEPVWCYAVIAWLSDVSYGIQHRDGLVAMVLFWWQYRCIVHDINHPGIIILFQPGGIDQNPVRFMTVHRTVYYMTCGQFACFERKSEAVGPTVDSGRIHTTSLGDLAGDFVPDIAEIGLLLSCVGFAALIEHERFYSALVGTHLHHLHINAYLVKHIFEIQSGGG